MGLRAANWRYLAEGRQDRNHPEGETRKAIYVYEREVDRRTCLGVAKAPTPLDKPLEPGAGLDGATSAESELTGGAPMGDKTSSRLLMYRA